MPGTATPPTGAVIDGVRPLTQAIDLAEALENWLGDPGLANNAISFGQSLELEERDEMPQEGIDRLRAFGFHRYFVPARLGGALRTADELLMLTRAVSRRDMNVMIAESTQLWTMLPWIAGDPAQQERYAAQVLAGGVIPCLAYSEKAHGADLGANEFRATPDAGEYVLNGEKWPINRGDTSTHVVLLGTTGDENTPDKRRESLFYVERSQLEAGTVRGLDRVPTYGLRGCDISGIAFENARVDASSRLGAEGAGLELALKGLLVTRTFCTGLSLGAGDAMLRTVADFLSRRRLYDGPASEIPYVSESLANSYVSLLVAECESLVSMRGMHLYLDEFSLWANLAKVQVARLVDANSAVLARVLGARYYMRAPEHAGIFQKQLRDGAIVSVFDGSEPVCLDSIALQLAALARAGRKARHDDWAQLYDLRRPLEEFDPARVTIFGKGRDAVLASLPALVQALDEVSPSPELPAERLGLLREQAAGLYEELQALFARIDGSRPLIAKQAAQPSGSAKTTAPQLMRLAGEVASLHTKVAALGTWLHNRDHLGDFFAAAEWLTVALARPLVHQYQVGDLDPATSWNLFSRMEEQRADGAYFSVLEVHQSAPGTPQGA
ncbi:acyl-CoA dehydrogenase family protein [Kineosporia corallincola]|nr:acyl-CoA dehydrogenase family protein [Kineosporia corallincola]